VKLSFSERKQFSNWLKEEIKTPEYVFRSLKLGAGTTTPMANPNLRTWSAYIVLYKKENPTNMVRMLGIITETEI
ncbi:hypothetical protein L916_02642, partial [Phytophthora nicotianae]